MDLSELYAKNMYREEYEKLGNVLRKFMPEDYDVSEIQEEIIVKIGVARSNKISNRSEFKNSVKGLFDPQTIAEERIRLVNDADSVAEALTEFIKGLRGIASLASQDTFEQYLKSEGLSKSHLKSLLNVFTIISQEDVSDEEEWLKSVKKQGRQQDTKHNFTLHVAEILKKDFQGTNYALARFISEIYGAFDVEVTPGAINQKLRDSQVLEK